MNVDRGTVVSRVLVGVERTRFRSRFFSYAISFALLRRVQAVSQKFLPHGRARNAEPFSRFRLVTACQSNGLTVQLPLGSYGHAGVSILDLATHHLREEVRNKSRQWLLPGRKRRR